MNKVDSALLGSAIVTLLIFAYGLKTNRGWKYWVFSMLFIPSSGFAVGYALGKEDPKFNSYEQPLQEINKA